jgi:eukaryotic-like serine/threonine-protein kinase
VLTPDRTGPIHVSRLLPDLFFSRDVADLDLLSAVELRLGRGFTIESELGSGATSRVYVARQGDDGERIVIKVMRLGTVSRDSVQRFYREMEILQTLNHPRIVPVLEPGEANEAVFFTMPYIEGGTLRSRLVSEGQLPIADALWIARDLADALGHVHAKGIVHLDVKPENIVLGPDGAYLIDFGHAHAPDLHSHGSDLSSTKYIVGTPDYVSPEQVTGKRSVDWRSDFFSLGCVTYEMLAGRTPFAADSSRASMMRRLSEPPTDVRVRRPEVSEDVVAILRRALAISPSDRFATAGAFRMALDASLARLRRHE